MLANVHGGHRAQGVSGLVVGGFEFDFLGGLLLGPKLRRHQSDGDAQHQLAVHDSTTLSVRFKKQSVLRAKSC
jgi:hypothetical protein